MGSLAVLVQCFVHFTQEKLYFDPRLLTLKLFSEEILMMQKKTTYGMVWTLGP